MANDLQNKVIELEKRLEKSEREKEKITKELDQFAYIASHDLQAPLRHISSFLNILEESLRDKLSEEDKKCIDVIKKGATSLQQMVYDLLEYSRVNKTPTHISEVNIAELIQEIKEEYDSTKKWNGAQIVCNSIPLISSDKKKVKRVLEQLVNNALSYQKVGQPAKITVQCEAKNDEVLISISDEGIGFKAADNEKIFQVFKRLKTNDKLYGTGMGLPICRKIIESLDGRIWAQGEPEKGATIFFTLPN